ncbi:MAG: 6-bladed beta-propeller [Dysgonamonadaceae bacterium]|nr:6-bladed beta-propeller [Dysgonamonadaceae bacterium]
MKINYIVAVLLCCMSCVQRTSREQIVSNTDGQIDTSNSYGIRNSIIPVDFDKPDEVSMLDYFKSVELIPLETHPEALIGQLRKIIYYKDRYYTLDRQQFIVHVFDDEGKFVFKIDKRGQGPGEYSMLDDIHINGYTGHLELLCPMGFVYDYDLSGEYVKTTWVTNEHLRAVHEIIAIDENTLVFFARAESNKIFYYDLDKEKIRHEEFEEDRDIGSFSCYYSFYQYNGEWYFIRPYHNVVYKVGGEGLEESYAWDFGSKYKYDRDGRHAGFSNESRNNPYKRIDEANSKFPVRMFASGQNNRYVLAQIIFKTNFVNAIYDKSVGQCKYIPRFAEGVQFRPIVVTDEYVLGYCNPGELENYVTESMLDEKNRRVFNELIHADANPVILKYLFK